MAGKFHAPGVHAFAAGKPDFVLWAFMLVGFAPAN
jgi:hypothetical protein